MQQMAFKLMVKDPHHICITEFPFCTNYRCSCDILSCFVNKMASKDTGWSLGESTIRNLW